MRKVEYPMGTNYEQTYLDIYKNEIARMRSEWDTIQKANSVELGHLPTVVDSILTASYSDLVAWYNQFKQLPKARRDTLNQVFLRVFNYDRWYDDIAEYFKNPKNGYKITSCHYCDMAYINVFETNPDADALYDLNFWDDEELQKLTKSPVRLAYVKSQRPYTSKADYDKVAAKYRWSASKWERTLRPTFKFKHHFDLDHVLPKSKFTLVGLSLYNLVPSCQICNQKLKRARTLGVNGIAKEKLSPSSPIFDFDNKAKFFVSAKPGVKAGMLQPTQNPQDYDLKLTAIDPDYDDYIKLFKLQERYQQHKRVALYWLEMKYKYTDARIQMMADSLKTPKNPGFSFARIKADIFQSTLYESKSMSFQKLRDDMLK